MREIMDDDARRSGRGGGAARGRSATPTLDRPAIGDHRASGTACRPQPPARRVAQAERPDPARLDPERPDPARPEPPLHRGQPPAAQRPRRARRTERAVKSVLDRLTAGLALLALAPLLALIAALVRATSRGPALFVQTRIGRDGTPFRMVKFRSMRRDAESLVAQLRAENDLSDGVLFKIYDDPRVTRVGRVLRKYSLDELPQLLNVLTGSMSLVGPRPALPDEVAGYGAHERRRLAVRPGLTGPWQIGGRSDLAWEQAVRLDLGYVDGWSLGTDVRILLRTPRAVLSATGAY